MPNPRYPAGALQRGAGSAPEFTAQGPTLALARASLESCRAAGEVRALLTADRADGSHVFVAMRNALPAVALNLPSSVEGEALPSSRVSG